MNRIRIIVISAVAVVVVGAILAAIILGQRENASPEPSSTPIPTSTLPEARPEITATTSPTDTPAGLDCTEGEQQPVECAGGEPAAEVIAGQMELQPFVKAFLLEYERFDSGESSEARAARLAPFMADGVETPASVTARQDSALIDLQAVTQIDEQMDGADTFRVSITGANEDGSWAFVGWGSVTATYTQNAQVSHWAIPIAWRVTLDPNEPHKVLRVTQNAPYLDGAP